MVGDSDDFALEEKVREEMLAKALQPIASELRCIDLASLARHILGEETANLSDLVNSASELFFKEGTLSYAGNSSIDLAWEGEIAVQIDLEFKCETVSVLLSLFLLPYNSAVSVKYIAFDNPYSVSFKNTEFLKSALETALL
ncbi:hypothetical protein [Flexibacterium corallicola]|uniref:hypothetical protein n=1 Tax=Flexibacterium corallicola TaxID=3037259 RepID=UPI00286F91FE|nr:hypothetical protein [Pseudovibrio sp. M1P-2-3]